MYYPVPFFGETFVSALLGSAGQGSADKTKSPEKSKIQ